MVSLPIVFFGLFGLVAQMTGEPTIAATFYTFAGGLYFAETSGIISRNSSFLDVEQYRPVLLDTVAGAGRHASVSSSSPANHTLLGTSSASIFSKASEYPLQPSSWAQHTAQNTPTANLPSNYPSWSHLPKEIWIASTPTWKLLIVTFFFFQCIVLFSTLSAIYLRCLGLRFPDHVNPFHFINHTILCGRLVTGYVLAKLIGFLRRCIVVGCRFIVYVKYLITTTIHTMTYGLILSPIHALLSNHFLFAYVEMSRAAFIFAAISITWRDIGGPSWFDIFSTLLAAWRVICATLIPLMEVFPAGQSVAAGHLYLCTVFGRQAFAWWLVQRCWAYALPEVVGVNAAFQTPPNASEIIFTIGPVLFPMLVLSIALIRSLQNPELCCEILESLAGYFILSLLDLLTFFRPDFKEDVVSLCMILGLLQLLRPGSLLYYFDLFCGVCSAIKSFSLWMCITAIPSLWTSIKWLCSEIAGGFYGYASAPVIDPMTRPDSSGSRARKEAQSTSNTKNSKKIQKSAQESLSNNEDHLSEPLPHDSKPPSVSTISRPSQRPISSESPTAPRSKLPGSFPEVPKQTHHIIEEKAPEPEQSQLDAILADRQTDEATHEFPNRQEQERPLLDRAEIQGTLNAPARTDVQEDQTGEQIVIAIGKALERMELGIASNEQIMQRVTTAALVALENMQNIPSTSASHTVVSETRPSNLTSSIPNPSVIARGPGSATSTDASQRDRTTHRNPSPSSSSSNNIGKRNPHRSPQSIESTKGVLKNKATSAAAPTSTSPPQISYESDSSQIHLLSSSIGLSPNPKSLDSSKPHHLLTKPSPDRITSIYTSPLPQPTESSPDRAASHTTQHTSQPVDPTHNANPGNPHHVKNNDYVARQYDLPLPSPIGGAHDQSVAQDSSRNPTHQKTRGTNEDHEMEDVPVSDGGNDEDGDKSCSSDEGDDNAHLQVPKHRSTTNIQKPGWSRSISDSLVDVIVAGMERIRIFSGGSVNANDIEMVDLVDVNTAGDDSNINKPSDAFKEGEEAIEGVAGDAESERKEQDVPINTSSKDAWAKPQSLTPPTGSLQESNGTVQDATNNDSSAMNSENSNQSVIMVDSPYPHAVDTETPKSAQIDIEMSEAPEKAPFSSPDAPVAAPGAQPLPPRESGTPLPQSPATPTIDIYSPTQTPCPPPRLVNLPVNQGRGSSTAPVEDISEGNTQREASGQNEDSHAVEDAQSEAGESEISDLSESEGNSMAQINLALLRRQHGEALEAGKFILAGSIWQELQKHGDASPNRVPDESASHDDQGRQGHGASQKGSIGATALPEITPPPVSPIFTAGAEERDPEELSDAPDNSNMEDQVAGESKPPQNVPGTNNAATHEEMVAHQDKARRSSRLARGSPPERRSPSAAPVPASPQVMAERPIAHPKKIALFHTNGPRTMYPPRHSPIKFIIQATHEPEPNPSSIANDNERPIEAPWLQTQQPQENPVDPALAAAWIERRADLEKADAQALAIKRAAREQNSPAQPEEPEDRPVRAAPEVLAARRAKKQADREAARRPLKPTVYAEGEEVQTLWDPIHKIWHFGYRGRILQVDNDDRVTDNQGRLEAGFVVRR